MSINHNKRFLSPFSLAELLEEHLKLPRFYNSEIMTDTTFNKIQPKQFYFQILSHNLKIMVSFVNKYPYKIGGVDPLLCITLVEYYMY